MSQLEYRVVLDRAGIKSVDHYFNIDRATDRAVKLIIANKSAKAKVSVQQREVTEWVDVPQ